MAQLSVNAHRFDPYKNFKFRIKWDGRYVAGFSKISALEQPAEVVDYSEGADPGASRALPRAPKFEPITLERGITHDPDFETWANRINTEESDDAGGSLADLRRDLIIDVFNDQGSVATAFRVYRCWVSEFQALPELDANGNAVAIETIVLQNEGWERDCDVTEPPEG